MEGNLSPQHTSGRMPGKQGVMFVGECNLNRLGYVPAAAARSECLDILDCIAGKVWILWLVLQPQGMCDHKGAILITCSLQNTYIGQAMGLFGIVLVLLLASRAVFLFPILAVHNVFCAEKLPFRHTVVAW